MLISGVSHTSLVDKVDLIGRALIAYEDQFDVFIDVGQSLMQKGRFSVHYKETGDDVLLLVTDAEQQSVHSYVASLDRFDGADESCLSFFL